ncbi:MAG: hypothetical protein WCP85_13730 [Mariniphaga sp.]
MESLLGKIANLPKEFKIALVALSLAIMPVKTANADIAYTPKTSGDIASAFLASQEEGYSAFGALPPDNETETGTPPPPEAINTLGGSPLDNLIKFLKPNITSKADIKNASEIDLVDLRDLAMMALKDPRFHNLPRFNPTNLQTIIDDCTTTLIAKGRTPAIVTEPAPADIKRITKSLSIIVGQNAVKDVLAQIGTDEEALKTAKSGLLAVAKAEVEKALSKEKNPIISKWLTLLIGDIEKYQGAQQALASTTAPLPVVPEKTEAERIAEKQEQLRIANERKNVAITKNTNTEKRIAEKDQELKLYQSLTPKKPN